MGTSPEIIAQHTAVRCNSGPSRSTSAFIMSVCSTSCYLLVPPSLGTRRWAFRSRELMPWRRSWLSDTSLAQHSFVGNGFTSASLLQWNTHFCVGYFPSMSLQSLVIVSPNTINLLHPASSLSAIWRRRVSFWTSEHISGAASSPPPTTTPSTSQTHTLGRKLLVHFLIASSDSCSKVAHTRL